MPSLTELHRTQQLALRAASLRELQRLWPTLSPTDLDNTYPGWAAAVARLIREHRTISIGLAVRYLRQLRAEQQVPGSAPVAQVDPLSLEQVATSLRVTSVVAIKAATSRGVPLAAAVSSAFVTSAGAATRLVLNGGRDAIRAGVTADPHARGWRRVTGGRSCGFCQMLAGRGGVYSADSATFDSHDHCGCAAEPVWGQ